MKRIYVYLMAVAGLAIAGYMATGLKAQAPAAAAPAATTPAARGTVAVFNVARVMKDFQRWQYFAATMNEERQKKGAELAKLRNQILEKEAAGRTETSPTKKQQIEQEMTAMQRQFEDLEKAIRKDIDDKSAKHLQELFTQIRTVVERVSEVNGFQLVMAYPDALTEEEMKSPLYYDLKLRPPAAMPFYVSPSIDITKVVVLTLNQNFAAPGPVPAVTPASGTTPAPAAPGAPPK
ncbi:OmpH family outer membrane protein [Limnoglobus roseus]|uniref:OmpH family outer membrane protein n=1 Tax=Limnoglobus roseus TaxID=2598579 RepID=A0A5C1APY7_9BACT|nr:OmpH family outer membrane protein [Limnoglobus roseus]QEL20086.1 OmpH family outer membrane protein [Limnoglobus roseus]